MKAQSSKEKHKEGNFSCVNFAVFVPLVTMKPSKEHKCMPPVCWRPFDVVRRAPLYAAAPTLTLEPLDRTLDLKIGETQQVKLCDGQSATVKLLDVREPRDVLRNAIRRPEVDVEVNGQKVSLVSANYRLPVTVAGVQIDCSVTGGYRQNSEKTIRGDDAWGLDKDARIRLWPAGSPLVNPGTFRYPARQRWFASGTHMANEPCHVDGGDNPLDKRPIYYHYGLDIGGAEALVDVIAATDGMVISSGKEILPGYDDTPAKTRYDVVYVLDNRGWYYLYSHFHTIYPDVKPGAKLKMATHGTLGQGRRQRRMVSSALRQHWPPTRGQVGHRRGLCLFMGSVSPRVSAEAARGRSATPVGLWQRQGRPRRQPVVVVGRQNHILRVDALRRQDRKRRYRRAHLCETGRLQRGPESYRRRRPRRLRFRGRECPRPGASGAVAAVDPRRLLPDIRYQAGDPVTFMVRTLRTTDGNESWDSGDGTSKVQVQRWHVVQHAKRRLRTVHAFAKPGQYIVSVGAHKPAQIDGYARLHAVGVE